MPPAPPGLLTLKSSVMDKTLRIAIIGTRGIPNRYGGFEAFAAKLSARLVSRGHRVTVYCPHNQAYRHPVLDGTDLVFRYNPESWLGTAGQFLYDLNCNLHARNAFFDIILHLGYTSDSAWGWLWSPHAKHVTNMDGLEWKRSKYASPVRRYLRFAEQLAARYSDLLIADSTAIRDYLQSRYERDIIYIAYGADVPAAFDPHHLQPIGLEPGSYDLLVARMEPENNIETAILGKTAAGDGIPLVIITNETSWGKRLKARHSGNPAIVFLPAVYDAGILDNLRHYSRFYLHGHSAGGTNPSLLEAMACGCRILAHDNPFNRAVLAENASYFSESAGLAALLSDTALKDRLTASSLLHPGTIRRLYGWEHITDEYEKAFYHILER